jgi:hypothetical protein
MKHLSGFARLRPLSMLAGLTAGTVALLTCERPEPRPPQPLYTWGPVLSVRAYDGGCSEVPAHRPSSSILDYYGKRWKLADMPGQVLACLDLRGAEWFGVDLHRARFVGCDFRGADLRSANLRRARLWKCDLAGADLTGADLTRVEVMGDTYDDFTRWPAGFDPQAHGARLDR